MAKKDHPGEAKVIKGKDEIATTRILPDVSPEANKDELVKGYEGQKQGGAANSNHGCSTNSNICINIISDNE